MAQSSMPLRSVAMTLKKALKNRVEEFKKEHQHWLQCARDAPDNVAFYRNESRADAYEEVIEQLEKLLKGEQ